MIHPGTNEVIVPAGWVRVENGPESHKVNRGQETPHKVVTEPKERPQVFSGPVAFQEEPTIKGKKLGDYIDSQGGVTEEEMNNALAGYVQKNADGDVSIAGDLSVTGDAEVGGDSSVTGDQSVGGDLEVTGDAKLFENIVDSQGRKRFIEGDIVVNTTIEGITKNYAKWSLSGSHLLIVVALSIANTTAITSGYKYVEDINLPQWVKDKIVVLYGLNVIRDTVIYYDENNNQSQTIYLRKSDNKISIVSVALTMTADREVRIQFDLLIDNE